VSLAVTLAILALVGSIAPANVERVCADASVPDIIVDTDLDFDDVAALTYRWRVHRQWRWTLRRRSQKARRTCDWATLDAKPWFQLPMPRLTHAWI
jgi:hypothetical protein